MNARSSWLLPALVATLACSGCGSAGSTDMDAGGVDMTFPDIGTSPYPLPPTNAGLDYQLGGAYQPPDGVAIVSRDREAPIAEGLYNLCYVNGFQVQPNEEDFWLSEHPTLVLRDEQGDPVIDAEWDEMLLDVGMPEKRAAIAAIVGSWITGCEDAGFDAIEIDNLDSFTRSGARLSEDDAVAMMRMFADAAHAEGMAISQKNSAELVGRRVEMGTDFVVAEQCNRYRECDVYTAAYGSRVLVIEYRRRDFERGCEEFPGLSIVFRDLDLVAPPATAYKHDGC